MQVAVPAVCFPGTSWYNSAMARASPQPSSGELSCNNKSLPAAGVAGLLGGWGSVGGGGMGRAGRGIVYTGAVRSPT